MACSVSFLGAPGCHKGVAVVVEGVDVPMLEYMMMNGFVLLGTDSGLHIQLFYIHVLLTLKIEIAIFYTRLERKL